MECLWYIDNEQTTSFQYTAILIKQRKGRGEMLEQSLVEYDIEAFICKWTAKCIRTYEFRLTCVQRCAC